MMTERNAESKNISLARTIGILETTFPETIGFHITRTGAEKNVSYLNQIDEIEQRGRKAFLVGKHCFGEFSSELAKNLQNEPEVAELSNIFDLAFLVEKVETTDEENEILSTFKRNNPDISETVVKKWMQIVSINRILFENNITVENPCIRGIDNIFERSLRQLSTDAERENKYYVELGRSPFDANLGYSIVDNNGYRKNISQKYRNFLNKKRRIIRKYQMKAFIKEWFENEKTRTIEITCDVDPNASPGRNHHTGLPYYDR